MINKKTVLILGAGSSSEIGFPLGKQLINEIYTLVIERSGGFQKNPGGNIKEAVLPNIDLLEKLLELSGRNKEDGTPYSADDIRSFAEDLRCATLPSIDDFLFKRPQYSLIGKLCILFVLSKYENAKRFYPSKTFKGDWIYPSWGWYEYLWHQLQKKTDGKFTELKKNKLSIITFNYDRSLEYFLFNAIESAYGLKGKEHEIVGFFINVPVKHVYGELGVLPWKLNLVEYQERYQQQPDAVNDFTPWDFNVLFRLWGKVGEYGATQQDWDQNRDVLNESARRRMVEIFVKRANEIRTYDEVFQDERCKEILEQAECIYFLGCGYHEQNISALGVLSAGRGGRGILSADIQVFGTAVEKSDIETEQIKNYVASFSKPPEEITIKNKWDGVKEAKSSLITSFLRNIAPLE